ncbi:MAG: metallophosphoesterase [Paracoccaceae bacterium]|nr:metallophosphoesterase [Paracoccaceae bacterium]
MHRAERLDRLAVGFVPSVDRHLAGRVAEPVGQHDILLMAGDQLVLAECRAKLAIHRLVVAQHIVGRGHHRPGGHRARCQADARLTVDRIHHLRRGQQEAQTQRDARRGGQAQRRADEIAIRADGKVIGHHADRQPQRPPVGGVPGEGHGDQFAQEGRHVPRKDLPLHHGVAQLARQRRHPCHEGHAGRSGLRARGDRAGKRGAARRLGRGGRTLCRARKSENRDDDRAHPRDPRGSSLHVLPRSGSALGARVAVDIVSLTSFQPMNAVFVKSAASGPAESRRPRGAGPLRTGPARAILRRLSQARHVAAISRRTTRLEAALNLPITFLHLTDLHISAPERGDETLNGDTLAALDAAIDRIAGMDFAPAFVAISGDLTHRGDPESYRLLAGRLERIAAPKVLALGNHDARGPFRAEILGQEGEAPFVHDGVIGGGPCDCPRHAGARPDRRRAGRGAVRPSRGRARRAGRAAEDRRDAPPTCRRSRQRPDLAQPEPRRYRASGRDDPRPGRGHPVRPCACPPREPLARRAGGGGQRAARPDRPADARGDADHGRDRLRPVHAARVGPDGGIRATAPRRARGHAALGRNRARLPLVTRRCRGPLGKRPATGAGLRGSAERARPQPSAGFVSAVCASAARASAASLRCLRIASAMK